MAVSHWRTGLSVIDVGAWTRNYQWKEVMCWHFGEIWIKVQWNPSARLPGVHIDKIWARQCRHTFTERRIFIVKHCEYRCHERTQPSVSYSYRKMFTLCAVNIILYILVLRRLLWRQIHWRCDMNVMCITNILQASVRYKWLHSRFSSHCYSMWMLTHALL